MFIIIIFSKQTTLIIQFICAIITANDNQTGAVKVRGVIRADLGDFVTISSQDQEFMIQPDIPFPT